MIQTWRQFERFWFFLSVGVILVALPFSKVGLSIGQFMLLGGWIEYRIRYREFRDRLIRFPGWLRPLVFLPLFLAEVISALFRGLREVIGHPMALLFASLFVMHLAGLVFTVDFGYAFKDIRTKLPLLLLPVVFATTDPPGRKTFYGLLQLFTAAVLVRSLYNAWLIASHRYVDIRDVAQNVSHIIFGLFVALSVFILLHFILKKGYLNGWFKALCAVVVTWFCAYLVISQSATGIVAGLLTLMLLLAVSIRRSRQRWIRWGTAVLFLGMVIALPAWLWMEVREYYHVKPVDYARMEMYTSRGNPYVHDYKSMQTENGNMLWHYVQWDELRSEWNRRSKLPFDSLDRNKGPVAHTLIRFLASKGWKKDADAVEKLTTREVRAIENGVANYLYMERFSIRGRVHEFLEGYEKYRETGDPSGSTVMQRVEFWRASMGIIRNNWLTGVGTGDMNLAFARQYEEMKTKLAPDQRWRSHNQYLSILVGFGIFGLAWFLFSIVYPPIRLRRFGDPFFPAFLSIALLSMLTNDTIETQTGVTFFAFFYTFLLFAGREPEGSATPSHQI